MSKYPVRILFTIPNFITAGSGHAMLSVIRQLDRQYFDPAVCVLRKGGKLDREVEHLGLPLLEAPFTIPARPYASLFKRANQIAQFFRPFGFSLWHSYHYSSDYTEPIIARLAGARGWIFTKKNMNWGERAWKLRSLFASGIGAQNTDMLAKFFSAWPYHNKAHYVPPGVGLDVFHPNAPPILELKSKFGISSQTPVVGCVANLLPVKGHPTLIQAFARLESDPMPHLWLAGKELDAAYSNSLHQLATELGILSRVHFLGQVNDIPALLAEVDIFCLVSKSTGEGCPIAMLEAMACAKACVGSDIPGIRDQIQHRRSGLLVPAEDPGALASALQELLDDSEMRINLGINARSRVQGHFSIEQESAAYQAMYQEILNR